MDDVKQTYREGETQAKETLRKSDGNESVADKVGNAGDEVRKDLGNAGDESRPGGQLPNDADYKSTTEKEAWRKSDGDESLADKVGNAGDEIRTEVTGRP